MPSNKPSRKGSASAEEDPQNIFALRVLELLGDEEIVAKIKSAIYPHALIEEIRDMKLEITRLHQTIDAKDKLIYELKDRVDKLEVSVDNTEQYSRRANLRIQGIAESGTGEDARAKVLEIFNQKMKMSPPLSDQDIERCHRLGRQTDPARPRCMIIRFKSERMRDSAYSARGFLKNHNKSAEPALRLYINEDLTLRRSLMAFQTRKLRAEKKIADCWTHNGHVVVKENNNLIKRINSPRDLNSY